jgi:hypothetical protein
MRRGKTRTLGFMNVRRTVAAVALLLLPDLAQANAGLPMLWILWPFAIVAIVPVVLVESWVVQRGIGLSWRVSLWEMSKANVASTLVGLPLTWIALVALEMLAAHLAISAKISDSYPPDWVGEVGAIVLSAPWLGPFRTGGHWIVPVATATLLVPFFLVSAWVEVFTVRKAFGASSNPQWRRVVWYANLASYGILFTATLVWLAIGLSAHGWSLA